MRFRTFLGVLPVIVFVFCGFSTVVLARPEYAVKLGVVNCAACHVSPFGGGARNLYGKSFASRNLGFAPYSNQDKISGDFRALLYEPTKDYAVSKSGAVLMAGSVAANIPLTEEAHGAQTHAVAAYNVGIPPAAGLREAYLLHQTVSTQERSHFKYFTVGRFNVPFGLMTDEHRAYVRVQTKTTVNDYEMGGAISGDPSEHAHFDLLLTNGFQNGGSSFSEPAPGAPGDVTWATIGNVRYSPEMFPFFLGTSASFHHTILATYSPWAMSAYGALSLDRLTHNKFSGSILGEFVWARGWNDVTRNAALGVEALPAADPLAAAVKDSESMGILLQANYDLSERWTLIYRFEEFAPDRRFTGDAFVRNGLGFRTFLGSNIDLTVRYEIGHAGRSTITAATSLAAANDVFALLHYWF